MTVKLLGAGTLVDIEHPVSSGTFVTIGCVYSVTPPGVEWENVESELCLSDTVSTTPDASPGDPTSDEITFEAAFEPGSTEDVVGARAVRTWRITYPGGDKHTFPGYLRRYKPQAVTRKEYMRVEGVIVRTGAIVLS